jgi:hypothetical protein
MIGKFNFIQNLGVKQNSQIYPKNIFKLFMYIYNKDGIKGLYSGSIPSFFR